MYRDLKDALDEVQSLDALRYFAKPVDNEIEPSYNQVIPDPMDFGQMRLRLLRGEYASPRALADDFRLLCRNAVVFNTCSTRVCAGTLSVVEAALWSSGCIKKKLSTQDVNALTSS